MQPFTVHWSPVFGNVAERIGGADAAIFALWPSPVNDDLCFREAGFSDFGDADEIWDANAERLLENLLSELSRFGLPRLVSKAVDKYRPWYLLPFLRPQRFDLLDQIKLPCQWDELPDCIVSFGESGVCLRTGRGHVIYWIEMPQNEAACFPELLSRVAAPHAVKCTELRWDRLV